METNLYDAIGACLAEGIELSLRSITDDGLSRIAVNAYLDDAEYSVSIPIDYIARVDILALEISEIPKKMRDYKKRMEQIKLEKGQNA